MEMKIYTGTEIRDRRKKSGLTQTAFWKQFHTTQTAGSRYESGDTIPAPVQLLLNIAINTEKQSAACVDALRAVVKPAPKKAKRGKRQTSALPFGFLP
jgi:transcriptional regulator with XRE-family HTH domain